MERYILPFQGMKDCTFKWTPCISYCKEGIANTVVVTDVHAMEVFF